MLAYGLVFVFRWPNRLVRVGCALFAAHLGLALASTYLPHFADRAAHTCFCRFDRKADFSRSLSRRHCPVVQDGRQVGPSISRGT